MEELQEGIRELQPRMSPLSLSDGSDIVPLGTETESNVPDIADIIALNPRTNLTQDSQKRKRHSQATFEKYSKTDKN